MIKLKQFINEHALLLEEFENCEPQQELEDVFVFFQKDLFDLPKEETDLYETFSKKDEPKDYSTYTDPKMYGHLKISDPNKKLNRHGTGNFNLPAGWSCPLARACAARINPKTKKIEDLNTQFEEAYRCYAASEEALRPNIRQLRWHNFNILKENISDIEALTNIISQSLNIKYYGNPPSTFRIHASGDFFHKNYFLAWIEVTKMFPNTLFYSYTKMLPFLIEYKNKFINLPNVKFVASKGGHATEEQWDEIRKLGVKYAEVGYRDDLVKKFGNRITPEDDDSLAFDNTDLPFGLVLHGTQRAGTKNAKEWYKEKERRRKEKEKFNPRQINIQK